MIAIKWKALISWPNVESQKEMKNSRISNGCLEFKISEKGKRQAYAFRKFICEQQNAYTMNGTQHQLQLQIHSLYSGTLIKALFHKTV